MWNKVIQFNTNDAYLNHMPIIHVSGLCIFFRALYSNFRMVLSDFYVDNYINYIKKNKINLISMVPSMLQKIITEPSELEVLQNLKAIIVGGSSINDKLLTLIKIKKIRF